MKAEELYELALRQWGADAQILKAAEEAAELVVALHHIRKKNKDPKQQLTELAGEIADVELMLDQVRYIFRKETADTIPFCDVIAEIRAMKILKLKRNLGVER